MNSNNEEQAYGTYLLGPSGSGKSSLCRSLNELFKDFKRPTLLVNLDPANEILNEIYDINIIELIKIEEVMEELSIGPNGSLIYAFDFLKENIS